jgi:hypothetical protein
VRLLDDGLIRQRLSVGGDDLDAVLEGDILEPASRELRMLLGFWI